MEGRQGRGADRLGDGLTSLCGGALALNVLLVLGLLGVLAYNGLGYFWQRDLLQIELGDGTRVLGELQERQLIPAANGEAEGATRIRVKLGNRDVTGNDFLWIDEPDIVEREHPPEAVLLERREWGNFYGTMTELRRGELTLARGSEPTWLATGRLHDLKEQQHRAMRRLERGEIGDVNREIEQLRLQRRRVELAALPEAERLRRMETIDGEEAKAQSRFDALSNRLVDMREEWLAETLLMTTADGTKREISLGMVVRAARPNSMGLGGKLGLYLSRLWEFVADDPRESNTEGGIFPAIFGTVMMVFLMSFAVAPLGVLAALYLREYAKQGTVVRIVRIAVNNLAGVPSIVFGVFGLGFFVYLLGGSIDRLFYPELLPTPTFGTGGILWASLTLALLTVPVVIVATEEGLASVPRIVREGSLALGATKFETTWRVVIPAAAPGILTGLILAMARAAGEVAPLMIVGMVKLAPALPIDHHFPFVHLERKFMHLGFHIYDVGFQSPNVEASKPMVFMTTLLLLVVILLLSTTAIYLRSYMARRMRKGAF